LWTVDRFGKIYRNSAEYITPMIPKVCVLFLLAWCLISFSVHAQEPDKDEVKRAKFEVELDPYYSSIGLYINLTRDPIPRFEGKTEWSVYRELLKKFYVPRTLIIETSINPLPYLGTIVKKEARNFYKSMRVSKKFNLVQAVTTGFEEPWAASIFLGNVLEFRSVNQSFEGKKHGYTGFLVDIGNFHIKDNELISDRWIQTEWKLKGEQFLRQRTLRWSFRFGGKFHGNGEILDSFFIAFRRGRTDFGQTDNLFLNNSGFEYIFDMDQRNLVGIRHYFIIDKKFPMKRKKVALVFAIGFVWTSNKKYSGSLANLDPDRDPFQILFQPNIEF